jgi:GNAT superfamily N-acetyltransferase
MSDPLIRTANVSDLPALNRIIEGCVMDWNLPERVKRLSLDSYRYREHDLDHLELFLAQDDDGIPLGVAAWEPAEACDLPAGASGLLLHGLYVDRQQQRQGTGGALVRYLLAQLRARGIDGLLVKAQVDAVGFFQKAGFAHRTVVDERRDYPHRYWIQA